MLKGGLLGDEVLATALLDRLLHHAEIIPINGPSYRMKERQTDRTGSSEAALSATGGKSTGVRQAAFARRREDRLILAQFSRRLFVGVHGMLFFGVRLPRAASSQPARDSTGLDKIPGTPASPLAHFGAAHTAMSSAQLPFGRRSQQEFPPGAELPVVEHLGFSHEEPPLSH